MSLPLRPEAEEVELLELGGRGDAVESSAPYWGQGGSEGAVGMMGYSMQACYQVPQNRRLLVHGTQSASLSTHGDPCTRHADFITRSFGSVGEWQRVVGVHGCM